MRRFTWIHKPPGAGTHVAGQWLYAATWTVWVGAGRFNLSGIWLGFRAWGVVPVVAVAVLTQMRHRGNLCATYIERAPLDPGAAADRNKALFRWWHVVFSGGKLARFLVVVPVMVMSLGAVRVVPGWIGWPLYVAGAAVYMTATYTILRHSALSPWCPYCRHDGWGDRDVEVAPTPDPVGTVLR